MTAVSVFDYGQVPLDRVQTNTGNPLGLISYRRRDCFSRDNTNKE
jgi:hypothetical protein